MSAEAVVLVGAGAIFVVTAVSGRLERVWLTEPLVIMTLGVVTGLTIVDPLELDTPAVLTVLELTLALVLFADASRIDIARLRQGYSWPFRMLVLGTPLAIVIGSALAAWYLDFPLGPALLIGVILAPTDAALAEPVLESRLVPPRVRETLNVESGLNDGLALPALLIAIGVIASELGMGGGRVISLVLGELGVGILGGIVIGWVGAMVIGQATKRGWMNPLHQRIASVALALAGFAAVQLLGGSGFVATFIAGGLMSHLLRPDSEYLYQFAEAEGHSLVLVAFFLFGTGQVAEMLRSGVSVEALVFAALALFVVRPLAIAISLFGQRLSARTVAFFGWFGPRGLATIVFLLVAIGELEVVDGLLVEIVTFTVAASILLHGLSAIPASRWLSAMEMTEDMPEMGETFENPTRR
jgi:NhaP-type Na+/H+ or K+/H+ antiporter